MLRIKGRLDGPHQREIIAWRSPDLTALLDGNRGAFNDPLALPARHTSIKGLEVDQQPLHIRSRRVVYWYANIDDTTPGMGDDRPGMFSLCSNLPHLLAEGRQSRHAQAHFHHHGLQRGMRVCLTPSQRGQTRPETLLLRRCPGVGPRRTRQR